MVYAASIGDELTDLLGNIFGVALKVIIFLIIMLIGWLIARAVYRGLRGLLERLGFDRAVERGGLRRMLGSYRASDIAAKIVQYALLLFTLQLAFGIFGPNPVSDLIRSLVAWLPRLFVAVVIVVVAAAIAGAVKDVISQALEGLPYGRALGTAAQVFIVALGLIAALNQIGVGTTVTMPVLIAFLAALAGVIVVGVGGGLIRPMQERWERMLTRGESEMGTATAQMRSNREARNRMSGQAAPGAFGQPSYGPGGPAAAQNVQQPTGMPQGDADQVMPPVGQQQPPQGT